MEKKQTEKKVFKHYYADSSFDEIIKWLESKIYNKDGTIKTYQPYIVIEIVEDNE